MCLFLNNPKGQQNLRKSNTQVKFCCPTEQASKNNTTGQGKTAVTHNEYITVKSFLHYTINF